MRSLLHAASRPGRRLPGRVRASARPSGWPRHRHAVRLLLITFGAALFLTCTSPTAGTASTPPTPGGIAPDQLTGTDTTPITGSTTGPCDVPGSPDQPVDGFNAVVAGPGVFAPDAESGAPDGVAVVQTDNVGFSTTEPIPFSFRATFGEIAAEQGGTLVPGDYVLTVRCVHQLFGTVHQTYTATYTFTGGPPATTFEVTAAGPGGDLPPRSDVTDPATAADAPAARPAGDGDTPPGLVVGLGVAAAALVVAASAYLVRRRPAPTSRK